MTLCKLTDPDAVSTVSFRPSHHPSTSPCFVPFAGVLRHHPRPRPPLICALSLEESFLDTSDAGMSLLWCLASSTQHDVLRLSRVVLYGVAAVHFVCLFANVHVRCSHLVALRNNAAVNIRGHWCGAFSSVWYTPGSGSVRSSV